MCASRTHARVHAALARSVVCRRKMISWCRNNAFSAISSDFPLVLSASVPSPRQVVGGLIQRENRSESARKLKQRRGLIEVNTRSTNGPLLREKRCVGRGVRAEWTSLMVLASHRLRQGGLFHRVQHVDFLNACPLEPAQGFAGFLCAVFDSPCYKHDYKTHTGETEKDLATFTHGSKATDSKPND